MCTCDDSSPVHGVVWNRGTGLPAQRSRTSGWRRCLEQIHQRNGAIEIAIDADPERANGDGHRDGSGGDLVFRARLVDVSEDELCIEPPTALGEAINLEAGLRLVGIIAIGQNRWTFRTSCLGEASIANGAWRGPALRLGMPDEVRRCQRRRDYRLDATGLALPDVTVWPLLDPRSVVLSERVNEATFLRERDALSHDHDSVTLSSLLQDEPPLPEVGPSLPGTLVNLGGGGIGLIIDSKHSGALHRSPIFWTQFNLAPHVQTPVCATMRLVHTHVRSDKRVYGGFTFDFTHNPSHKRFVVQQIIRAIAGQQKRQLAHHRSAA